MPLTTDLGMTKEGMEEEMRERLKPKMHNMHLSLTFSSVENIVILFPKISNDPRELPKKFMVTHLEDPQAYFDRVLSFNATTLEYSCNGDQISDDLVGVSNTFLQYMEELKTKDAGFNYIELYHNRVRVTSMVDKRSIFNRAVQQLKTCASGKTIDLFKISGNTIRASDIISYLNENVVRASQEPARYRAQLKKMWEQLVTSSIVQINTENGPRLTNGILLRVEDTAMTNMFVQLFLYLETPDIVQLPETVLTDLNEHSNALSERHPEMTTLVFATSDDYEFFNLILNGLFNIPIWKCYGKVSHFWTYEEGMPYVANGMSLVKEDLFADSGLTGKENTDVWNSIEDKFIQYHLYLIHCLETNMTAIQPYREYTSFIRNDGTPMEKVSLETEPLTIEATPGTSFNPDIRTVYQTRDDCMTSLDENIRNQLDVIGKNTDVWEAKKELSCIPWDTAKHLSPTQLYQEYLHTFKQLHRMEKKYMLLQLCAEMGITKEGITNLCPDTVTDQCLDGMIRMAKHLVNHVPPRGDDMLKVLASLAKS